MDSGTDLLEMRRGERSADVAGDEVVFEQDGLVVRHMTMDWQKLQTLWGRIQSFRTLFSDITRGDYDNFARQIANPGSLWLEIMKGNEIVGIFSCDGMEKVVDYDIHILFFDRDTASPVRVNLCKRLMEWLFNTFPIQRASVTVPRMYYATVRLAEKVGFKKEGKKRQAVLIGGKWNDLFLLGLTRAEAVTIWDS